MIQKMKHKAQKTAKYYFDVLGKESTSLYSVFLFFFLFFCHDTKEPT